MPYNCAVLCDQYVCLLIYLFFATKAEIDLEFTFYLEKILFDQ